MSFEWKAKYGDEEPHVMMASGAVVPLSSLTAATNPPVLRWDNIAQGFVKVPPTSKSNRSPKQLRGSIFISHSKVDLEKLVKPAARRIKIAGFDAYIASMRAAGKNPAEKIVEAMLTSKAVFAIITHNVTDNQETRDWVLFEMGSAKSWRKKIFGWKTKDVVIPEPIKQITDYFVFDDKSKKETSQMLHDMSIILKSL